MGDGKTYTLAEECYMHDFMHGEMLDKRWGSKERVSDIDIIWLSSLKSGLRSNFRIIRIRHELFGFDRTRIGTSKVRPNPIVYSKVRPEFELFGSSGGLVLNQLRIVYSTHSLYSL